MCFILMNKDKVIQRFKPMYDSPPVPVHRLPWQYLDFNQIWSRWKLLTSDIRTYL